MRSPWPTGGCCAKIKKKELRSRVAKLLGHVTKDSILKMGLRDPWLMSTRSVILTAYIYFP